MSRTSDLLQLQDVDARSDRDQGHLAATEASIAADPELDGLRRVARRSQRERREVEAQVVAQDVVVDGLRRRARELDRHLYDGSVRNPQELLGMQHELEGVRGRVSAEEDLLLSLMERAEVAAAEERDRTAAVVQREQERAGGATGLIEKALATRAAIEDRKSVV